MRWLGDAGRRYGECVRQYRAWFLVVTVVLSAAAIALAPTIETTADPTAYLPQNRPEVRQWLELNTRFGALDLLLVGLEEPTEPLSAEGLRHLAEVTRALEARKGDGVLSVRSLSNVDTLSPDESGTLHADRLFHSVPVTAEERDALARRILADTQVVGALVSRDLRGYTLVIRPDPRRDSREVAQVVEDTVESLRGPLSAFYFGGPFVANLVTRKVYDRLPWLVPLFAGLLMGTLAVGSRAFGTRVAWSVFLIILGGAGLSLVWWLGLLRIVGLSLTISDVNGLLLVLVMATVAYARFADARASNALSPPSEVVTFSVVCALALAGLYAVGPVLPAPLPFLGRIGVLLSLGFVVVLALGWIAVWPLLTRIPIEPDRGARRPVPRLLGWRMASWAVMAIVAFPAFQVRFVSGLRDLFSRHDEVGLTLDFFDRRFAGSDFLQVSARGDLEDPVQLARIHRLTDLLEGAAIGDGEQDTAFSDVRSIAQIIAFLARNFSGAHRIPDEREALATLWFFLDGNEDVRALVTPGRDEAMLTLRIEKGRDPSALLPIVEGAIRDSADTGITGTAKRLEALARRYRVDPPPGRSAEVLADLSTTVGASVHDSALVELRREMESPESPFVPTDEEWTAIASLVRSVQPARVDLTALEQVIRSLPSFQAHDGEPDLATRVASMIRERTIALDAEVRADQAVGRWLGSVSRPPEALLTRAKGVFQDFLTRTRESGEEVRFLVTGYPTVVSIMDRDLRVGMFQVLIGTILAVFVASWVASRRVRPPLGLLFRASLTAAIPLGVSALTGMHVDSGSATMLLAGPVAAGLLSRTGLSSAPIQVAALSSLSLAVAALSLLTTGVLPVIRIGALLGVALLTSTLTSLLGPQSRSSATPCVWEKG